MGLFSWLFGRKNKDRRDAWKHRAVVVGINRYPGAPLAGCVNDALTMKKLLMDSYGFSDGDIKMLTDEAATTDSILEALRWLASAEPNTIAYLHLSGHGTQVPTGDPSEPDGLAEVFCPCNFAWDPQHMITDDQFIEIFSKMRPGVIFNFTSDSCHSGGLEADRSMNPMTKFGTGSYCLPKSRTMPMPAFMANIVKHARSKREMKKRAMLDGMLDVGFASACRSDQTAADAFIDGRPCGAMTHYFAKAIRELPRSASLDDIIAETRKNLARNGYDQVPQTDGTRAKKPFLG